MKRLFQWLGMAFLVVACAVMAGALIPRPLFAPTTATELRSFNVVLLSTEIHTDIAIPLYERTRSQFAFLAADGVPVDDPSFEWLIIGWGGRDFYLKTPSWSELQLKPLLKGLTIDRSVLRFDVAHSIPADQPHIVPFDVSEQGIDRLVEFVQDSFRRDNGAPVLIAGAGYGALDRFYEAKGYFNALIGCNTWTATALRRAGLRTGWWNPMPQSLALSLRLFN